jgi:hypothetical protein
LISFSFGEHSSNYSSTTELLSVVYLMDSCFIWSYVLIDYLLSVSTLKLELEFLLDNTLWVKLSYCILTSKGI